MNLIIHSLIIKIQTLARKLQKKTNANALVIVIFLLFQFFIYLII